jgi:hypothetical protein
VRERGLTLLRRVRIEYSTTTTPDFEAADSVDPFALLEFGFSVDVERSSPPPSYSFFAFPRPPDVGAGAGRRRRCPNTPHPTPVRLAALACVQTNSSCTWQSRSSNVLSHLPEVQLSPPPLNHFVKFTKLLKEYHMGKIWQKEDRKASPKSPKPRPVAREEIFCSRPRVTPRCLRGYTHSRHTHLTPFTYLRT